MKYSSIILFITLYFIACNDKKQAEIHDNGLGEVVFEVTGSEEAKPYFQEGLLLLHSFEFEDAAEKFIKAQEIDSTFVMAYWGEAMSYNHPLWKERFIEEGRAALNKLAKTKNDRLSKASTDLERELLQAVEILYSEGDKIEQDIAYKDFMEKLHNKYPTHNEVSAFYALSLLGSSKNRTEDDNYNTSAKIVQSIIDENPKHPGALHYLIHSYDDPDHATLALEAANSYAQVAPDAEHALHMPSHIFVALGMWDKVIQSNIESYEASVKRMEEKNLDNDARGYHAYKWLMYGYLQKGDFTKARKMVYNMKKYCEEKPSSKARSHFIMMKADYLTETNNWKDSIANVIVSLDKLNTLTQAVQIYTQGMLAYNQKNIDSLSTAIVSLNDLKSQAKNQMIVGSPKMCSGVSSYLQPPSVNEVKSVEVLEFQLRACLALINQDSQNAEEMMKRATNIESETSYTYGPPNIVKPSFEFYGEWLLKNNRKKEAKEEFEKVLERAPKRRIAQEGLENSIN